MAEVALERPKEEKKEWGWTQKSVWTGGAPMNIENSRPESMSQPKRWSRTIQISCLAA